MAKLPVGQFYASVDPQGNPIEMTTVNFEDGVTYAFYELTKMRAGIARTVGEGDLTDQDERAGLSWIEKCSGLRVLETERNSRSVSFNLGR